MVDSSLLCCIFQKLYSVRLGWLEADRAVKRLPTNHPIQVAEQVDATATRFPSRSIQCLFEIVGENATNNIHEVGYRYFACLKPLW